MKKSDYLLLGVNIDHVATIRQARHTIYPSPLQAALLAEEAGADGITLHLREDRRHIQDGDLMLFRQSLASRMNLEMAVTDEMLAIAEKVRPEHVCFVPEKRNELTTEGGLDVLGQRAKIAAACQRMHNSGIIASLFIDPNLQQIQAAKDCGATVIEIHTGAYAEAKSSEQQHELARIIEAARYADSLGLIVNAGHGLNYHNVQAVAAIPELNELNIGHAIIARALMVGIKEAVREMKRCMREGRLN